MSNEIAVHWHSAFADEILQRDWEALERNGVCTPFQTRDYVGRMIAGLPALAGAEPLFLRLTNAASGDPLLILPLEAKLHYGARRIDFLDYWVADHQMPIFDPKQIERLRSDQAVETAMVHAFADFDIFGARAMPPEWLGVRNPLLSFFPDLEEVGGSFRLALDDNLPELMRSKSVYKKARKNLRRLKDDLGVELVEIVDTADLKAAFAATAEQRAAKFEASGVQDNFANPEVQAFFLELAQAHVSDGRALVQGFRCNGEWVASTFANALGDVMVGQLFSAADGPWMKFGPGIASILYEIEWAQKRGLHAYDFGAGLEPYKAQFGATVHPHSKGLRALNTTGQVYLLALKQKQNARAAKRFANSALSNLPFAGSDQNGRAKRSA